MTMQATKQAVLLLAHGTVERLDDLPAFVAKIRRGHAAPPEVVAELRRRYEAIGGRSPLNAICRRTAEKLEAKLGVPVRFAARLWAPYPQEVLGALADEGVTRVVAVALAQHSAHVYGAAVEKAAAEIAGAGKKSIDIAIAPNWGGEEKLIRAYASAIAEALRPEQTIVMTAHSLPVAAIRAGDAYEREVRASAEAIHASLGQRAPFVLAYQSRGMDGGEWLGPDLESVLRDLAKAGRRAVLVAPVGFLADHVEILYDLDIEARALCESLGMTYARSRSLNDSDALVDALVAVVQPRLA
jgi:ferrochelatase